MFKRAHSFRGRCKKYDTGGCAEGQRIGIPHVPAQQPSEGSRSCSAVPPSTTPAPRSAACPQVRGPVRHLYALRRLRPLRHTGPLRHFFPPERAAPRAQSCLRCHQRVHWAPPNGVTVPRWRRVHRCCCYGSPEVAAPSAVQHHLQTADKIQLHSVRCDTVTRAPAPKSSMNRRDDSVTRAPALKTSTTLCEDQYDLV